jgi:PAS domain S-box-containing protein
MTIPVRHGIGLRLLALILLFSTSLTLLMTAIQLYADYRLDTAAIANRLGEIERSNLQSLARSLWNLDAGQIALQLEGLLRLPDMQAMEVREAGTSVEHPLVVSVGARMNGAAIARDIPIVYDDLGTPRTIGVLHVEATLEAVYQRLVEKAAAILVDQGIKIFLTSLFILFIIHRVVTRHLADIAAFFGGYAARSGDERLALRRPPPRRPDELDRVVGGFNGLLDTVAGQRADLVAQEARARATIESLAEGVLIVGADGRIRDCNARAQALLGHTAGELVGTAMAQTIWTGVLADGSPVTSENSPSLLALRTGLPQLGVLIGVHAPAGEVRWFSVNAVPLSAGERALTGATQIVVSFEDVTELRRTQEQLVQAQKMEAVGRLTGGVAHDFNNLLSIVSGNLELLAEQLDGRPDLRDLAARALYATGRGAALTRSLLAFARKQPLQARRIDLRAAVDEVRPMLSRTLGEAIAIEVAAAADLAACEADAAQLQAALLNLVINARDAMRGGGKLTIELSNAWLDADYAAAHPEVTPGGYGCLAVSDTGVGMAPEVLRRAFEPFFTTKKAGEGSGLGLSMVYGFAKQSRGHVRIYSELGHGTTVKLYLPRSAAPAASELPPEHARPPGGSELILVVEDDPEVLRAITALLRSLGYAVREAATPTAALALLESGLPIKLLLTDVILSRDMNGRELAERALRILPELRVLYMSGYTENVIVHGERVDSSVELIEKPVQKYALALKLRSLLDKPQA